MTPIRVGTTATKRGTDVSGADAPGTGPGPEQELSEEEIRQYLGEMRQAPAAEIIAQVITVLANGAQVKLGRNDARVLIDAIGAVKSAADSVLPTEFAAQVDDLLGQLRMAQVEGEKEVAHLAAQAAQGGQDEHGGLAEAAPGDAAGPTTTADQQGSSGSRLWTPGR